MSPAFPRVPGELGFRRIPREHSPALFPRSRPTTRTPNVGPSSCEHLPSHCSSDPASADRASIGREDHRWCLHAGPTLQDRGTSWPWRRELPPSHPDLHVPRDRRRLARRDLAPSSGGRTLGAGLHVMRRNARPRARRSGRGTASRGSADGRALRRRDWTPTSAITPRNVPLLLARLDAPVRRFGSRALLAAFPAERRDRWLDALGSSRRRRTSTSASIVLVSSPHPATGLPCCRRDNSSERSRRGLLSLSARAVDRAGAPLQEPSARRDRIAEVPIDFATASTGSRR